MKNFLYVLQGNIVLADSKYEVLTLLRSHRDDEKGYALMPRHPYPVHAIRYITILRSKLWCLVIRMGVHCGIVAPSQ